MTANEIREATATNKTSEMVRSAEMLVSSEWGVVTVIDRR